MVKGGVGELAKVLNYVTKSENIPKEWRDSLITPISEQKRDSMEYTRYSGTKLRSHVFKLYGRIIKNLSRKQVDLSCNHFGFSLGFSITNAIFKLSIMEEKLGKKQQIYHFAYVHSEKAYDTVPTKLIHTV